MSRRASSRRRCPRRFAWTRRFERSDRRGRATVTVRRARTPADLLLWIVDLQPARLIVCDACRSADVVGTLRRRPWPMPRDGRLRWSGTHDLDLPAVLDLASQLRRMPDPVLIWTVEAGSAGPGEAMGAVVAAALPALVEQIRCEWEPRGPAHAGPV